MERHFICRPAGLEPHLVAFAIYENQDVPQRLGTCQWSVIGLK